MGKKARLTFDMDLEDHSFLKTICAYRGINMKKFIIDATMKTADEIDDNILTQRADAALESIKSGKTSVISLNEFKKKALS